MTANSSGRCRSTRVRRQPGDPRRRAWQGGTDSRSREIDQLDIVVALPNPRMALHQIDAVMTRSGCAGGHSRHSDRRQHLITVSRLLNTLDVVKRSSSFFEAEIAFAASSGGRR